MILQRYIALNLARGWLIVLLVLGSVFGLISFIGELSHTRFDYNSLAVARYTLLTLPQQLVELAPVIALLGSILALANLDRFNELTIISCTGFPLTRLLGAIALPTVLLMAGLWIAMEYVTPQLQQSAERERHLLRYRNDTRIPDGGLWSANNLSYIHLGQLREDLVHGWKRRGLPAADECWHRFLLLLGRPRLSILPFLRTASFSSAVMMVGLEGYEQGSKRQASVAVVVMVP